MKKGLVTFLQIVIVLIGIGILAFMLWEPHLEGRNAHATFSQIYFNDPFLAYAYIGSIAFFIALYHIFKVLGYAGQNTFISQATLQALHIIKWCGVTLIAFVVVALGYLVVIQRHREDDIAGGVALGLFIILISVIVTTITARFERSVQSAVELKSTNKI